MKKQIKLNRLFISMLMLGCSLGFVACSDDDETTPTPPVEVTTDHMFGNYTGKNVLSDRIYYNGRRN